MYLNADTVSGDVSLAPRQEIDIDDLGLAVEFFVTTMRALARGHDPDSHMVQQPLQWGFAKLHEAVGIYLPEQRPL